MACPLPQGAGRVRRVLRAGAETLEQLLEEWAQERVRLGV